MAKILIIEDEAKVADFMVRALLDSGYEAKSLPNADHAIDCVNEFHPDLILLDAMLPGKNGFEFLATFREKFDLPVIMVTALGGTKQKVAGLDIGADDYLVKPFKLEEMLARVRAQLRRRLIQSDEMTCGSLHIDYRTRKATVKGHQIFLSQTEYAILEELAKNLGKPVSKKTLLSRIWDDDERGKNVVEVYVHYLRNKIEMPGVEKLIHTIRGKGYLLSQDGWDAERHAE